MNIQPIISIARGVGQVVMLFAIGLMVLASSLPVSEIMALEFDPVELMDMEEESEERNEKEENKEKEKFSSGYASNGSRDLSGSNLIYFKEHHLSEVTGEINTPPPERS